MINLDNIFVIQLGFKNYRKIVKVTVKVIVEAKRVEEVSQVH